MANHKQTESGLKKTPTGIQGLDEITGGGLPRGRPTLLCGGAGSGKTLMGVEFIVKGISDFDENGAFISFEESEEELSDNVASLGHDLRGLIETNRLFVKNIDLEIQDIIETGDYDLEGLFVQMGFAIDQVNAKRVVIDGIETLFSYYSKASIIRKELRRLFRWLKDKGVTAIITGEHGEGGERITRHGIEEYVSDCVILLDQRLAEQISTRRLRILKYRGSVHGTNEYPFLITDQGISVLPVTSLSLDQEASSERVSTGIGKLDEMLSGQGYYKGSGVLISGTAGTGKSSVAASFAHSICENGERCIYFAFEESASQIVRNMASIGLNLKPFVEEGKLSVQAVRPTQYGLEMHLLSMNRLVEEMKPAAVIFDPISNLTAVGHLLDIKLMFVRILDYLKQNGITILCTNLTPGGNTPDATEVGVSSIMDAWILLQHIQEGDRFDRSLYILKARGMAHSKRVHPFEITDHGVEIQ